MDLLEKLPKQFVHHDLLVFNLLAHENKIKGVLDFDFISLDVSFMEFAICLNHVLQMSNGSLEMAEAYIRGYAKYRKGSSEEITYLQLLTQIYHIAVLHIYIGQHYSGVNVEQNFNYILNQFKTRNDWLTEQSSPPAANVRILLAMKSTIVWYLKRFSGQKSTAGAIGSVMRWQRGKIRYGAQVYSISKTNTPPCRLMPGAVYF
ncbi:phosphotransferase [Cohnella sp.]|uniref:phosphotransferase n=1 Tax=Cohnella sp. TaxID=1883426 RepID=UPI003565899A